MVNTSESPHRVKFRIKVSVFTICLFLSTLTWLVIKLSKDYTVTIDYVVIYDNFPEDLVLVNQMDSTMHLTLKAKGFDFLFKKYFSSNNYLHVNLPDLKPAAKGSGYYAVLPSFELTAQIQTQTGYKENLITISPETLFFNMEKRMFKKVPVYKHLKLDFQKQYQLYDSISVEPDSIVISGREKDIQGIHYVETNTRVLRNLDKSESFIAKIKRPKTHVPVMLSRSSVNIFIPVEKFTELSLILPVELTMFPEYHLRVFPDKAKVTFRVAMKDYKKIDPAMFALTIDPVGITSGEKKLNVVAHRYPYFINNLRIEPESVEYIIVK